MRALVIVVLTIVMAVPLAAATLDVKVESEAGSAVPDAVVYAIPAHSVPIGHVVATMDQKDRAFVPHVLPIQTGTWVQFPNSDNIRHQVYSISPARRFQLPLYTGKPAYPLQFPNPGIVTLGCNIHDEMSAYIVVVDTPYFARTEGGHASLPDLQPGQYTLHVWYPEMHQEPKTQSITVGATDHLSVSFVTKKG